MTLSPGSHLGPYEILGPLGAGGMGEVFRARDVRIGREVAVKVLPASFATDPERLGRFDREARAAGQLNHPNVLTVFDVGRHEGAPFLVLELLQGETLRERLASGPMPLMKALSVARQLAQGLAAAHAGGIIHRDLKPENLYLTRDGRAKILDFGLARQVPLAGITGEDSQSPTVDVKTGEGVVLGTVGYMAPEQVRGEPADARSDLFAFGAVLFEMLTGRRAFDGTTAIEVLNAILSEDPPPPSSLRPGIPPGVDLLVRRCLERSPQERYQSAQDLAFHLLALSSGSGLAQGGAARMAGSWRAAWTKWVAGAASLLVLAAVLMAAVGHRSGQKPLSFERLTFQHGGILHARFTSDGQTVVFGGALDGAPSEVYLAHEGSRGVRPLGIPNADVLAVSPSGDIVILLKTKFLRSTTGMGTLATVPLTGGAPREIAVAVTAADVTRDGRLALIRRSAKGDTVEFPPGTTILESQELWSAIRVSPGGERLLVGEWDGRDGTVGLVLLDLKGGRTVLASGFVELTGADFAPSGEEVWASGSKGGDRQGLFLLGSGRERLVSAFPDLPILHDVGADGRLLIERNVPRVASYVGRRGEPLSRDLSWTDGSAANAFSADGRLLVFREIRPGGGGTSSIFFRNVDGSPPVLLGDGVPTSVSPDGNWVLTAQPGEKWHFTLLPLGPGTPRLVDTGELSVVDGLFLPPDGKSILFGAADSAGRIGVYLVDLPGGKPRGVNGIPEGSISWQIAPDGRRLAGISQGEPAFVFDLESGRMSPVPGARPSEVPIQWSADGRFLWIGNPGELPVRIFRVDVATGAREPWIEVPSPMPPDAVDVGWVALSADGTTWLTVVNRVVASDLFIATRPGR